MIRFAIRNDAGLWRSARWSEQFGDWEEAQLWENQKAAQKEVKRWKENWKWVRDEGEAKTFHKALQPVVCEIVPVTIREPK